MNVYTYWHQGGERSDVILGWAESWAKMGFCPVVLSLRDAKAHPYFSRFVYVLQVRSQDFHISFHRWMRWLAFAAVNSQDRFIACDWSIYNISFGKPGLLPPGLTFWEDGLLASGSSEEFLNICKSVELFDDICFKQDIDLNELFVLSSECNKIKYFRSRRSMAGGALLRHCASGGAQELHVLNNREIPVFMHIPRCGGSYVFSSLILLARHYRNLNRPGNGVVHLEIFSKSNLILRIAAVGSGVDRFESSVQIEDFLAGFHDIFIIGIIVEPAGVSKIKDGLLECLERIYGFQSMWFSCIRSPWELAKSHFKYLSSKRSSHEPTHEGYCKIEDYILSEKFPDSWLLRNIFEIYGEINEDLALCAVIFLKKYKFCTINNLENAINRVARRCYNFSLLDMPKEWLKNLVRNDSDGVEIPFESISEAGKRVFLERSRVDAFLYKKILESQG